MCEHKHSEIKFCNRDYGLEPILYCSDCSVFINEYLPEYEHSYFTHGAANLQQFLSEGTDSEIKEKYFPLLMDLKVFSNIIPDVTVAMTTITIIFLVSS
ncbi:MAG: hypothetical protein HWD63_16035 [Candidatus Parvibacillus calidus]|nr:MAG: hypothetical protein HWD63_16035 [Candidatus Parvibacillus calidus]